MKCPIMTAGRMTCDDPLDFTYVDCLGSECAWWSVREEECGIHEIPMTLFVLARLLEDMLDKMPHEEQFRT